MHTTASQKESPPRSGGLFSPRRLLGGEKRGGADILRAVIVSLVVLCIAAALYLHGAAVRPFLASLKPHKRFPHGELSDILYEQKISHIAFHSTGMKRYLAQIFEVPGRKPSVAIVGMEWGAEVGLFADLGYRVYAFEPMTKFYSRMRATVDARRGRWDVHLYKIAAGSDRTGNLTLTYNTESVKMSEVVSKGRVDDYVKEELTVYSIDIQGNELDVLKGSQGLLGRGTGARSLWIEIFSCNYKVLEILRLLDKDYVIMDFVPWGRARSTGAKEGLTGNANFLHLKTGRPSKYEDHFQWMCDSRKSYKWLQSDILAVRRDLMTPDTEKKLRGMADDLYLKGIREASSRRSPAK